MGWSCCGLLVLGLSFAACVLACSRVAMSGTDWQRPVYHLRYLGWMNWPVSPCPTVADVAGGGHGSVGSGWVWL